MKDFQYKGSIYLLIAAIIWGSAFVFQDILIEYNLGIFNYIFFRSVIGSIVVLIMLLIRKKIRKKFSHKETLENNKTTKTLVLAGMLCGLLMAIACGSQQQGMKMYPEGIPVVGRTAFITSTYVVLTAIVQTIRGKKPHIIILVSTVLSVVGIYFLSFNGEISNFYVADVIVLVCVVASTFSIFAIDYFSFLDGLKISLLQLFFASIFVLPFMLLSEGIQLQTLKKGIIPILFIGIFSSGLAYTFQILGQKYTEPIVSVLIMCMESVFAAFFAFLFLAQKMSSYEIFGALMVIMSVILAQIPNLCYNGRLKKNNSKGVMYEKNF